MRSAEKWTEYAIAVHAILLVAMAAAGWPPWSLLLLFWPALGYWGTRGNYIDALYMYSTGCVLMAAGHISSLCIHVPWTHIRALTIGCVIYECLMLAAAAALIRRRLAARRGHAVQLPVPPSSRSSIVPV